jgi:hypothetical protein
MSSTTEGVMRTFAFFCCTVALVSCARSDRQATTDTGAAAGALATISLADVAGRWRVRGTNEAGDSIVSFELNATADTSGWTMTLPNQQPVPVRVVAVAGDSIVTEAGPYESALRKGVQVRTHSVARIRGDQLVGTTIARYQTSGPDSVLRVRTEGRRAP